MSSTDSLRSPRYTAVAIGLHWALAVALIAMILVGWNMEDLPRTAPMKKMLYQMHKSIGITILFLTLARLAWRLLNPPPPPPPMPAWQRQASASVHWAFYTLMILMPLTGWIMVSASPIGLPTVIFGTIGWPHIPFLAALDPSTKKSLAPILHNAHGKLAWVVLALLALHVAAAIKHQFFDRDQLIARIAPKLFGKTDPPVKPARGALLAFGGAAIVFILVVLIGTVFSKSPPRHTPAGLKPNWSVATDNSSIGFSGTHDSRTFKGQFQNWQANIRFEPDGSTSNAIDVRIDMTSAQTGDAYYDRTLVSGDWFDARTYPYATFTSHTIINRGGRTYLVSGVLTIRGQQHSVSFLADIAVNDHSATARFDLDLDRIDLGVGVSSDPSAEWVGRSITVSSVLRADRPGM